MLQFWSWGSQACWIDHEPIEGHFICGVRCNTLDKQTWDMNGPPTGASLDLAESLSFGAEGSPALSSLNVTTCSVHNRRTLSCYGGVQKVAALLKATVIQFMTLTSALVIDECSSGISTEETRTLQGKNARLCCYDNFQFHRSKSKGFPVSQTHLWNECSLITQGHRTSNASWWFTLVGWTFAGSSKGWTWRSSGLSYCFDT